MSKAPFSTLKFGIVLFVLALCFVHIPIFAADPSPRHFVITVYELGEERTGSTGFSYRELIKSPDTRLCSLTQEVEKAWRFKDLRAFGGNADIKVWKSPSLVRVLFEKTHSQVVAFDGTFVGRDVTHYIRVNELAAQGEIIAAVDRGDFSLDEAVKFGIIGAGDRNAVVAARNKVLDWTYATYKNEGKTWPCRILEETPLDLKVQWLSNGKVGDFLRVRTPSNSVIETDRGLLYEATFDSAMRDAHPIEIMAVSLREKLPVNIQGKILEAADKEGYIDQGARFGLRQNLPFVVYRSEGNIVEEGTGKVLGDRRKKVAEITVNDVQRNISTFKVENGAVAKGDQIEFDWSKAAVAVLGLTDVEYTDVDGKLPGGGAGADRANGVQDTGRMISEQLTLALANKDLRVVERALLQRVLAQLQLQQPGTKVDKEPVFDEKLAKQFGKQVGARFVVTGTVAAPPKSMYATLTAQRRPIVATCNVRIVDVETGEIVAATAANVPLSVR